MMLFSTFTMILVFALTIGIEAVKSYRDKLVRAKWAGAMETESPFCFWEAEGGYACFLSHYKMEAASDCRYLHDVLCKMLHSAVYYDSSTLSDLRTLFTEGIHESDCVVLLATKGVLTRPWCLLEILESHRKGIPIIPIGLSGLTWDPQAMREFVEDMEGRLSRSDPPALELLHEHLGDDLSELQTAVNEVIDKFESDDDVLTWNPHVGDNEMIANLKMLVERMAEATDRKVHARGLTPLRP